MYVMYIFYDRSYLCAVYQRAAKLLFLTLNPHGYLIFNAHKYVLFGAWAWRREVAQKLNPPTTKQLTFSKVGQFQPYENFQASRHRHQVVNWIISKPSLAWN